MSRTKMPPPGEPFGRAAAYLAKNAGPMCEKYAQRLRSWLGSHSSEFNFTNNRGQFLSQTWQDDAVVKKSGASVEMGWGGKGAAYGYVLERGPRINRWTIAPKNPGVKALRFIWGGKVSYFKKVTHVWDRSMLRPHWSKAIEANQGWFAAEWGKLTSQAMDK